MNQANEAISLALQAMDKDIASFAASKPHLAKMYKVRKLGIIWPGPQACPKNTGHLSQPIEKVHLRVSFADLVRGWVKIEDKQWSLALDSLSLHLMASAKHLQAGESFAAVAHLQQWKQGWCIAAVCLTTASQRKLEEKHIKPYKVQRA